jgi:hypothetical protein
MKNNDMQNEARCQMTEISEKEKSRIGCPRNAQILLIFQTSVPVAPSAAKKISVAGIVSFPVIWSQAETAIAR